MLAKGLLSFNVGTSFVDYEACAFASDPLRGLLYLVTSVGEEGMRSNDLP